MKAKYIYIKFFNFISGFSVFLSKNLALNYCMENNAGDMFNKDYIKSRYNKGVAKYSFGKKDHILFCGSILGRSNKYSTVLGAGFISESQSLNEIDYKKIVGVRGKLTAKALLEKRKDLNFIFLGDPGLLAREVIKPKKIICSSSEINRIGIIPHFMDLEIAKKIFKDNDRFFLIDIRRDFKSVCKDILTCDVILSSSLHGLIFSDSMNVPNMWIKFSSNLIGGDFKFLDYYSVMDNPKLSPILYNESTRIEDILNSVSVSKNNSYEKMREAVDLYIGG